MAFSPPLRLDHLTAAGLQDLVPPEFLGKFVFGTWIPKMDKHMVFFFFKTLDDRQKLEI